RCGVHVSCATDLKEYREIEKDAALERRFKAFNVKERIIEESVQILQGIKGRYEEFHGVSYSDEVVNAFVNLSDRYIQDRFLPDKAIDLMDEVGSRLNLANASKDTDSMQQQINKIIQEKEEAAEREDYEKAENLRYQENQ